MVEAGFWAFHSGTGQRSQASNIWRRQMALQAELPTEPFELLTWTGSMSISHSDYIHEQSVYHFSLDETARHISIVLASSNGYLKETVST